MKRFSIIAFACAAAAVAAAVWINAAISGSAERRIYYQVSAVPRCRTALVLGASVKGRGRLSHILEDRMLRALELYKAGRVSRILLSGDHGTRQYDEVSTMRIWLLRRRVPPADIFLDHAGFSTYDSVVRARRVFLADDLVIVTQRYHLPRALYIAEKTGLRAIGLVADRRRYVHIRYYRFREFFANLRAFMDVATGRRPRFLGPAIPITGDGRKSWY
ncbi:MAG: YdcF family protein [Spirochaetes bacterium]|nr:YdcF family protein [Spirochaetota bacterium]